MELITCTPYIRFADQVCFTSQRGPSRTYDCRLLYTLHGGADMVLGGTAHVLHPGCLVMFQPGTEYTILPDPSVTMLILDFDFSQAYSDATEFLLPCPPGTFCPEKSHDIVSFPEAPALEGPVYLENALFLENVLWEIVSEFRQKRLFYRGKASSVFQGVLFDLARALEIGTDNRGVTALVLDYIEHHLDKPLTNREIGKALNYNPNYLNRVIRQHTGISLHQYLLQRRLEQAAIALQSTTLTIQEIAVSLGFHSASHFSSHFKRATGVTPAQYRNHGAL